MITFGNKSSSERVYILYILYSGSIHNWIIFCCHGYNFVFYQNQLTGLVKHKFRGFAEMYHVDKLLCETSL